VDRKTRQRSLEECSSRRNNTGDRQGVKALLEDIAPHGPVRLTYVTRDIVESSQY